MKENTTIYSNNVLDSRFEELFLSKCKFVEEKYNNYDLKKLCYKDVCLMGSFLINLKPKSHVRKYKKIILKYLDFYIDFDKPLNQEKRIIQENIRDYLMKISKFLEKYDFNNSTVYNLSIVLVMIFEIFVICVISRVFYIFPYFTILSYFYYNKKKRNLRNKGKLLNL